MLAKTKLFANRFPYVLDRLPNLSSSCTETFLNIAACSVSLSLFFEVAIVDCPANSFFGLALRLIKFSFELISIW
jgi:hypothetical protein